VEAAGVVNLKDLTFVISGISKSEYVTRRELPAVYIKKERL